MLDISSVLISLWYLVEVHWTFTTTYAKIGPCVWITISFIKCKVTFMKYSACVYYYPQTIHDTLSRCFMILSVRFYFHVYLTLLIPAKNYRANLGLPRFTKRNFWVSVCIVRVSIYRWLLNGPTADICYCCKSRNFFPFFLRFPLTGF